MATEFATVTDKDMTWRLAKGLDGDDRRRALAERAASTGGTLLAPTTPGARSLIERTEEHLANAGRSTIGALGRILSERAPGTTAAGTLSRSLGERSPGAVPGAAEDAAQDAAAAGDGMSRAVLLDREGAATGPIDKQAATSFHMARIEEGSTPHPGPAEPPAWLVK